MTSDRKAAIAAYKERKTFAGVFVIRCKASTQAWVGQTPNLEKIQNRIWFTLRQGSHTCRTLQAAWTAHGPDSLTFEECERLEEEETRVCQKCAAEGARAALAVAAQRRGGVTSSRRPCEAQGPIPRCARD